MAEGLYYYIIIFGLLFKIRLFRHRVRTQAETAIKDGVAGVRLRAAHL